MENILAEFRSYDMDEIEYEAEYELAKAALGTLDYPILLIAHNSNWKGQSGVAEASDPDDLLYKVASFDGTSHLIDEDDHMYFRVWTHDRPTGFTVTIEEIG